ncbi:MAG: hypothetical protein AB3N63_13770 [Puniceicoccaceae bacterium]
MTSRKYYTLTLLSLSCCSFIFAQSAQQSQQTVLGYFGAQVGNDLDVTSTSCYLGTAGTLVTDTTTGFDYILSNSHVLAREGEGAVGEDILHNLPSLCNPNSIHVGELAADIGLRFGRRNTNLVDAAIARITPNVIPAIDGSGRVLHIGNGFSDAYGVSNSPINPAVNMNVKKSGRTTGLTRSSISQVGVNVVVRYNGGRAYFNNQFVVSGGGFSAGGDSGSLIVTDNADAKPVGLLFAGSSSSTIGNPINAVINAFQTEHGISLSFGTSGDAGVTDLTPPPDGGGGGGGGNGGGRGNGGGKGKPKFGNTAKETGIDRALAVRDRNESRFLDQDGVLGSGIGVTNGAANITVFINKNNKRAAGKIPSSIEGIPVVIELTDEFVAY